MWLAFAAAIALFLGGQLLTSVTGIVLAFRLGNAVPLVIVIIVSFLLLRISGSRKSESPLKDGLNILAWACAIFLMVTVMMITIPFGLVAAIISAGSIGLTSRFIQSPSESFGMISESISKSGLAEIIDSSTMFIRRLEGNTTVWSEVKGLPLVVFEVPTHERDKVLNVMRDRPRLPISLTLLTDFDVLIVETRKGNDWAQRVQNILEESNVSGFKRSTDIVSMTVLALPLLETGHGLDISNYRLVNDSSVVTKVLQNHPLRMTVFPGPKGLRLIVPDDAVSGFDVQEIPASLLIRILVQRDARYIPEEENDTGDTA